MSNVNLEDQKDVLYEETLEEIKKVYKPRLKNLSKNKLIDMVVEMSAHIAALKQKSDENAKRSE
jgi:hypothetical protein